MKNIEGLLLRLCALPVVNHMRTSCILYKLLIRTTIISGAGKRNHGDTNMLQSNQIIYIRD